MGCEKNRRRRIILKKIIDLLLVLIVLMMGIGGGFLYREGMGYVDYALRRGNSKDPWGPPQAFEEIYPYPNKGSSSFTATAAMNALCGASLPII